MDTRLFKLVQRPVRLRRQDLPLVARAIVGMYRKKVSVKAGSSRNLRFVVLEAPDFQVQVLEEDWAKIAPFIQDSSLNPDIIKMQVDTVWSNPEAVYASALVDITDRQYYLRVLGLLQMLFTEAYPEKK